MKRAAVLTQRVGAVLGRRDSWRTVSLVALGLVSALLVTVGAVTQEVEPAVHFTINGNGVTGELSYTVAADGTVNATLLGAPAHGLLAGRHLVLRRSVGGRDELWDGWLSNESGSQATMVAGTVTVTDGGSVTVLPWFGQSGARASASGPAQSAPAPAKAAAPGPSAPAEKPRLLPAPAGAALPAASATPAAWSLAGRWSTPQGIATIEVDASKLSALLPDGRTVSGRMTGPASLVLGLGIGCCKGDLEGPDQISWSDGTVWYRGR